MGSKNSVSTRRPYEIRLAQKKNVYTKKAGLSLEALQDYFDGSNGPNGKTLRAKSGSKSHVVSRSGGLSPWVGLVQRWKDRGGKDKTRLAVGVDTKAAELVKAFPHNNELKEAAHNLIRMRSLQDGSYAHTAEFEQIVSVLLAAKRMQDDIQATVQAMRDKRQGALASMAEAYASSSEQAQPETRGARNAMRLNQVWRDALAQDGSPSTAKKHLERVVLQASIDANLSPAKFLEKLLSRGTASHHLNASVFETLIEQYRQLRFDAVHQLTPQVMHRGNVDLDLMDHAFSQSVPTGRPMDWIGPRPAGVSKADAAVLYASKLHDALEKLTTEHGAQATPTQMPHAQRLSYAINAVLAQRKDGLFYDTVAFREAMMHLSAVRKEADSAATSNEAMSRQELDAHASDLEDRYVGHLERLNALTDDQLVEQYGEEGLRTQIKLADNLNQRFAPASSKNGSAEVDEAGLVAYFQKLTSKPRIAVARLLTETATPLFLDSMVYESVANLSIRWELEALAGGVS